MSYIGQTSDELDHRLNLLQSNITNLLLLHINFEIQHSRAHFFDSIKVYKYIST